MAELQTAISFLQQKSKHELLHDQTSEILNLLGGYSKTLSLLEQYDTGTVAKIKGAKASYIFEYGETIKIIKELRSELAEKGEAGDLFGSKRDSAFEGIIRGLYQSFGGKEAYPTIEEKAAHLLYFIIKDHPFSDGNKRIGSFLFVYYLDRNNYLYRETGEKKINDNALVALALLVAVSNPKDKDVMIKIIINLVK